MFELLENFNSFNVFAIMLATFFAVIFSIVIHEVAHAYIALKNGDDTAKMLGRITLNPLKHFDIIGFFALFLLGFGWAKPVPISPHRFRNFKKGMILVSIAGVTANIIMSFLSFGLLNLILNFVSQTNVFGQFLIVFFYAMGFVNVSLFVFNLIPVYPLDGFNLLAAFLGTRSKFVSFMRQYGMYILIAFIISPLFSALFNLIAMPIINSFIYFWSLIF